MHDGWKEAMIGAGIVAGSIATGGIAPVIAGGIAGGYLFFNGTDNFVAGAQQMYSGEHRESLTNQTFQHLGLSSFWANDTETALSLGSSRAAFASKVEQSVAAKLTVNNIKQSAQSKNFSLDELSKAASAADRAGLTVSGRSLTKHGAGARPGNSLFPLAK